ncbi:hypothetical protein, partial [Nonomuraea longicatena]|uniref:hypothetical protein n=1 Tax=Nonomuraea longicatena TaxID=83682 RepID=UPI0031E30728
MALLRLLTIGFLGGVVGLLVFWTQRGDGFEHVRLDALLAMEAAQVVTVPLGLVVGIVLAATRTWTRTPGYVLGSIAILFGAIVATQGWATTNWLEGPGGVGDTDGEFLIAFIAQLSGVITTLLGLLIVFFRWNGHVSQVAPPSGGNGRSRQPLSHVEGHSPAPSVSGSNGTHSEEVLSVA